MADPIRCVNCNRQVQAPPNWQCPECKESCEYDAWTEKCGQCGQQVFCRRVRHQVQRKCLCKQPTPEQAAKEADFDRLRVEREERDREKARQGENRRIESIAAQNQQRRIDQAAECYAKKNGRCTVVRHDPTRPFCEVCQHLIKPIKEVRQRRVERPAPAGYRPPMDHPNLPVNQWKEIDSE